MTPLPSFDHVPDPLDRAPGELPRPLSEPLSPRAPDRVQTKRRRQAASWLSVGWLVSHLTVFGVRHDLWSLPPAYAASQIAAPFALALGSLYVALRPGRWGLGSSTAAVASLAIGGPAAFGLLALASRAPLRAGTDAEPLLAAVVCSDLMLVWMSAPLFAAAFALRRAFAAAAVWRSALVGSGVGLASAVTISLHCANADPIHLLVGHATPVAAGSVFAALVVTRWLRA